MDNRISGDLNMATLHIRNQASCREQWANNTITPFLIDDTFLCAGGPEDQSVSGRGDSGSPLLTKDPATGRYVQTGLVSWGPTGAVTQISYPSVFTRVSVEKDWIQRSIAELIECAPGFGLTSDGLNCRPCVGGQAAQPSQGKHTCLLVSSASTGTGQPVFASLLAAAVASGLSGAFAGSSDDDGDNDDTTQEDTD